MPRIIGEMRADADSTLACPTFLGKEAAITHKKGKKTAIHPI